MTATLPDQDNAIFERLLRGSAKQSYDPEVDVDWDAPLVDGKWGITPERISIYGTELWDSLTLEQQITLSNHEAGSMVSAAVWFELMLMQVMLRDLYDDDMKSAHMHYALTEVADADAQHPLTRRQRVNDGSFHRPGAGTGEKEQIILGLKELLQASDDPVLQL